MDATILEAYVEELESFLTQAKHPMTKQLLQDAIFRNKTTSVKSIKPQQTTSGATQTKPTIQVKTYGWDQTTATLKIYISDIPNLETANEGLIFSEFTETSVHVKISDLNGRNYNFYISELSGKIKPDSSNAVLKRGSVIVSMPKASQGSWESLTMVEKKAKETKKEKEKVDENKTKDDPSASIMNMMQKMYEDGDDEMKRTISKAWYETRSGKTPKTGSDMPDL